MSFDYHRTRSNPFNTMAQGYGISVSAYLRILAIEDRERQERLQLRTKCYPQRPIGNGY